MTDRADLPVPDYDHLPVGSLQGRMRSLDASQLRVLLEHEEAHGGSQVSEASAQANNQPLRHGVAAQTPNRDIRGR